MLASLLNPPTSGKVEFSYSSSHSTPLESGCYALTTFDGTILYIGQAVNICNRMEQHLDSDKNVKTRWGVPYWLYYKLCPVYELDNLETGWVNEYKIKSRGELPYFNKINPPS